MLTINYFKLYYNFANSFVKLYALYKHLLKILVNRSAF